MSGEITIRELKFAILKCLASGRRHQHKFNIIGKGYGESPLESAFGSRFEPEQRHFAVLAFDELVSAELIRPTYTDLSSPEDWVEITDSGREALRRRELDALDRALGEIASHLLEVRAGAWAAVSSGRPDALRQAAHSGRELIDQVLKQGAPDEVIRSQPWFQPAKDSRSGITRRHRLRYVMETRRTMSDSALAVAEAACELVVATDARVMALAHGRETVQRGDVNDALLAAEIALRRILVGGAA